MYLISKVFLSYFSGLCLQR